MNTRIRYLVLDSSNSPQRPKDHGLTVQGLQKPTSPSFLAVEDARKFAMLLASRNHGERYYVAQVLGGAVSYDSLDLDADENARTVWADATVEGEETP